MPREATGELRHLADGYAARITIEGRTRRDFVLAACPDEVSAAERCKALAQMASRLRRAGHAGEIEPIMTMGAKARAGRPWDAVCAAVEALCAGQVRDKKAAAVPTMREWARRWTSGELAKSYPDHIRKKSSAGRDEELLRLHVLPHVDDVRVDEFDLTHAEFVMANVSSELAPGTRRHVAQTMSRLMRIAVYPGKLRASNPIPPGWLPRLGDPKAKEALYPDEDTLLLAGKSVQSKDRGDGPRQDVPLLRRLAYGILSREGLRVDELSSLRWRDVDLKRGRVNLDENKTNDARDWDLRPDVVEALKRWKAREGDLATDDAHVLAEDGVPLPVLHLADRLRVDLRRVGITRPQLFERSKARQPIRAHDLRATFITISLATGKDETFVSDRTGHQSHEMINAYRRKARTWNLGPLAPLHEAIPELSGALPTAAKPLSPTAEESALLKTIAPRLPHAAQIDAEPQRAQRKPIP